MNNPQNTPAPAPQVPPRRLVITKAFIQKFIRIARGRWVSSRQREPNASLSFCRDAFWKRYPHSYRKMGKIIARHALYQTRNCGYDEYASLLDSLTENQLEDYITILEKKFCTPTKPPQPSQAAPVQPPPPAPAGQAPSPGSHAAVQGAAQPSNAVHSPQFDPGSGGSGMTEVDIDDPPAGFASLDSDILDGTRKCGNRRPFMLPERKMVEVGSKHQLMARIKQSLMTVTQCRTKYGLEDGDLDMDRLADIGRGVNLRGLFTRTTQGRALATACQIYVDGSGSMENHSGGKSRKFVYAERLCAALGSVLQNLRIPFQVIMFDQSPLLLKDFHTAFNRSLFWKYRQYCGGTILVNSLLVGLPILAARREPRKLAIIITDEDVGMTSFRVPATIPVRKQFPMIETLGFGVGGSHFPKGSFDYQMTGLADNLVEEVSQTVASVIVKKTHNR